MKDNKPPTMRVCTPPPNPIPPKPIAGVKLKEQISLGHLAAVYRGERKGEDVAIKISRSTEHDSSAFEYINEKQDLLRSLDHPCVAKLLDWGQLGDGSMYLVSPWIAGHSLESEFIHGLLPHERLLDILWDISAGLGAIHALGLTHGDIRPSNIMLPSEGTPHAVLLDMGHPLILGCRRTDSSPLNTEDDTLSSHADLFSLGVIFYRALTGHPPYPGNPYSEREHTEETIIPPREHNSKIPQSLEDLCLWLLAKDPRKRVPNPHVLSLTLSTIEPQLETRSGELSL